MADDIVNGVSMPESTKLVGVADESQKIGEFLDWLQNERQIILGQYPKEGGELNPNILQPVHYDINTLLAEFFNIDLKKVEAERRQLLESLQNG